MTEKNIVSNYKPEIDGIRAFAVIAVIINHFNKELLPSGYLGVDIFFCNIWLCYYIIIDKKKKCKFFRIYHQFLFKTNKETYSFVNIFCNNNGYFYYII